MLISVHIPKTGGRSFRSLLVSRYGDGLYLDYKDRPMSEGTAPRVARALAGSLTAPKRVKPYQCVHGHFLPIKYRGIKNASYAIWLRDPVERLVSRYYYWKRRIRYDSKQFLRYIKRDDLTLEEFAQIEHYNNIYAKYLFGFDIERFSFVGIVENYDESLACFKNMYGYPREASVTPGNVNPDRQGERYEIGAEVRRLIRDANKKDQEIYERALRMNEALLDAWTEPR